MQNWKREICIYLKINFVETKFTVRGIITIIWVTCVKIILRFKLKLKSYWQNIILLRNCPKIHIFTKNCNFFKYNCILLDQLLLPCTFHGSSLRGMLFFNFASCELLKYGLCLQEGLQDEVTINKINEDEEKTCN